MILVEPAHPGGALLINAAGRQYFRTVRELNIWLRINKFEAYVKRKATLDERAEIISNYDAEKLGE